MSSSPPQDFAVSNLHIQNNFTSGQGVFGKASASRVDSGILTTDTAVVDTLFLPPAPAAGYLLQSVDTTGLVAWVAPTPLPTPTYTIYSRSSTPVAVPHSTTVNMLTLCNDIATPFQSGNVITLVGTSFHLNNANVGDTYTITLTISYNASVSAIAEAIYGGDVTSSGTPTTIATTCTGLTTTLTTTAQNAIFTVSIVPNIYGGGAANILQCLVAIVKN